MITQEKFQQRYKYETASDRLGEGGFGEVFKAYDTFLDRWVAIKVSKIKADFPELRLKNEVELVNKLPAHPNIARYEECYTFNSLAGEYDFGILQYYELGNLLQLLQNQTLNLSQKYYLLSNLLEGIRFIHSQDIIHRDIKPQNILIVKRDNNFIPKITDFGISKKLTLTKNTQYSNSLIGAGTIAYSSPEQLADKTIRKNTDLWSFGVIAFHLFIGNLPFNSGEHSTSSELGRQEILKQVNSGKLPQTIDSIPAPWKSIIEKCLVTDPALRIKDAEECILLLSGQKKEENQKNGQFRIKDIDNEITQIVSSTAGKKIVAKTKHLKKPWIFVFTGFFLVMLFGASIYYFRPVAEIGYETNNQIADKRIQQISEIQNKVEQGSNLVDSSEMIIKPKTQPEEKPVEQEIKPVITQSEIIFPNGDTYFGYVKNGKMHGKGKYYFKTGGLISKDDPMERKAEAGNYIEGDWIEGELYIGYLFDKNGIRKERLVIGRNQ
ncbi:MAG: protein kinase [Bacteroidota bacterium]|nr:protein kinase [Bacteroidota bacterium]